MYDRPMPSSLAHELARTLPLIRCWRLFFIHSEYTWGEGWKKISESMVEWFHSEYQKHALHQTSFTIY